jgi:hypothetical protein
MRRLIFLLLTAISLLSPGSLGLAQGETPAPPAEPTGTTGKPAIQFPLPGQALQGTVSISGTTAIADFQSAEIDFAYADNPLNTWFLIAQSQAPVDNGELAQWDTTTISDGVYSLRLTVTQIDGSQQSVTINGLRVRNYTPIETNTPIPITPTNTPVPGDTAVPTITPTPTATPIPPTATSLPPNPAQLSTTDILGSAGKGALAILGLFVLIGFYRSIRSISRRK